MPICPGCGEENPSRFRLCGYCGTALAPAAPAHEVRKTVTVVFSDLKGSTSLGEQLDPEALREVMARYFDVIRAVLERHGGTVEKFIGDAVMAVFGLPRLHEDDALRAVRAALEMRDGAGRASTTSSSSDCGVRLANRTGVNTGEVVAGDPTAGQRLVTGDTVNVAARLEQAAPENEILIGESTYRLVQGRRQRRGRSTRSRSRARRSRVPAYRLLDVVEATPRAWPAASTRRSSAARPSSALLLEPLRRRRSTQRRCELVTVLGERRRRQVAAGPRVPRRGRRPGHVSCAAAACPTARASRSGRCAAAIAPGDRRVAAGAASSGARPKLDALVGAEQRRRRRAARSGDRPVDRGLPAAGDVLGDAPPARDPRRRPPAGRGRSTTSTGPSRRSSTSSSTSATPSSAPVLVLCPARHELLEEHPEWAADRPHADPGRRSSRSRRPRASRWWPTSSGRPTSRAASRSGSAEHGRGQPAVRRADALDADRRRHAPVGGRSSGSSSATWTRSTSRRRSQRCSPRGSISSPSEERTVVERAAVIGQTLLRRRRGRADRPSDRRRTCTQRLQTLSSKELVAPDRSDVRRPGGVLVPAHPDPRRRVRRVAQADASRAARALRRRGSSASPATGPRVRGDPRLSPRAGLPEPARARSAGRRRPRDRRAKHRDTSRRAGRRASCQERLSGRLSTSSSAPSAVLDQQHPFWLALVPDLADALFYEGRVRPGRRSTSSELLLASRESGDLRLHTEAQIVQMFGRYATQPENFSDVVVELAEDAIVVVRAAGDHAALSEGLAVDRIRSRDAAASMQRPRRQFRHAVDEARRRATGARSWSTSRRTRCRPPTGRAGARGDLAVAVRYSSIARVPAAKSLVLCALASSAGSRWSSSTRLARSTAQARDVRRPRPARWRPRWCHCDSGPVEMLAGDPAAAERELRSRLRHAHLRSATKATCRPPQPCSRRPSTSSATTTRPSSFTLLSEEMSYPDDLNSEVEWRCARARIFVRRGDYDRAEVLARDAVPRPARATSSRCRPMQH